MGRNNGICIKCLGAHTGTHVSYCRDCYNKWKRDRYPLQDKEKRRSRELILTRSNPEKYAEKTRKARAKDPEKARAYIQNYRKNNPEKVREWDRRKHQKRKVKGEGGNVGSTPISHRVWKLICEKYGNKCSYCGAEGIKLTIDHAIPLSRGGDHSESNLRPACRPCNGAKWARTPEEFDEYRKNRLGQRTD